MKTKNATTLNSTCGTGRGALLCSDKLDSIGGLSVKDQADCMPRKSDTGDEFDVGGLVPLNEWGTHVLAGFDNAHVVGHIAMLGMIVPEMTSDGLTYFRVHDDYANHGLFRMGHVHGVCNGNLVNVPEIYLTQKGVKVLADVFKFAIAGADRGLVKSVVEISCGTRKL